MIRRLRSPRPPLTVDEYIRRATLALPRAERIEAAAELRAHLLERVSEYQERGYSREEAEFLAVRAMGEPTAAHPGLWRERLRAAGWGTLALLCAAGLGWTAYREWLPPRAGVELEPPQSSDTQRLFSMPDAPRGTYQAATLTLPKGTKTLVYVNLARDEQGNVDRAVFVRDITKETARNIVGRVPGSYRYQARWLWTTQLLTCDGQPRARIWVTGLTQPSPFWKRGESYQAGVGQMVRACANPSVRLYPADGNDAEGRPATAPPLYGFVARARLPLRLNQWTVLETLGAEPEDASNRRPSDIRVTYIAVLPSSLAASSEGGYYSTGSGELMLTSDGEPLPPLPALPPPR